MNIETVQTVLFSIQAFLKTPIGTWEYLAWVQATGVLVFLVASWSNVQLMIEYKAVRVLPLSFALLWFGRGLFMLALTVQTSYSRFPPLKMENLLELFIIIAVTSLVQFLVKRYSTWNGKERRRNDEDEINSIT